MRDKLFLESMTSPDFEAFMERLRLGPGSKKLIVANLQHKGRTEVAGFTKLKELQKRADSDAVEIARLETFIEGLGEFDEWDEGTVILGEYAVGYGSVPQVWLKHGRYWFFRGSEYDYSTLLDNLSDVNIAQVSVVTEWSVVYPPGEQG